MQHPHFRGLPKRGSRGYSKPKVVVWKRYTSAKIEFRGMAQTGSAIWFSISRPNGEFTGMQFTNALRGSIRNQHACGAVV